MTDLPDPLTASDCDLRDLDGFMLNVERLLASELWALATGKQLKAALGLWCRAWKQVPAASLPNDIQVIAGFAALPLIELKRDWAIVMRGFVLCSDDRLYHRTLASVANKAFASRQRVLARINRRLGILSVEWALIRAGVFQSDNYTCQYCGQKGGRLECDHVLAVSSGGKTQEDNLVTACFACNRSKGSRPVALWLRREL